MAGAEVPSWLEGATDRDLYRRNAFRISGLAVTATPRAVRRRVSQVRAAEAIGATEVGGETAAEARWLPLEPAPDHVAVREALRRLEDPVRRIVEEFFWFWPLPDTERAGLPKAREVWGRLAGSGTEAPNVADPGARSIAVHNLAVLNHAEALELKGFVGSGARQKRWRRAYRYWRRVLDDDGCWCWLDERIRVLDDPRLRAVSSAALQDSLPAVLLAIHARIAVHAAKPMGGEDIARQHVSLMREFETDERTVDAVLRRATAPTAATLMSRTGTRLDPDDDPAGLNRAAASLLKEAEPDLRVLRCVLDAGHPVVVGAADSVASAVNARAVACANMVARDEPAAGDPRIGRAVTHLRSARQLAASGHVRAPIEQNLAVLLSNDLVLACNEAVERGEKSSREGARRASRLLKDAEPRLREVRELRPDAPETDHVHDAVAMAACRLFTDYFNATSNVEESLAGCRRALAVAVSARVRSVIQQNIDRLTEAQRTPAPVGVAPRPAGGGSPLSCRFCGRPVGYSDNLTLAPEDLGLQGGGGVIQIRCCAGCRELVGASLPSAPRLPNTPYPRARRGGVVAVVLAVVLAVAVLVMRGTTRLGWAQSLFHVVGYAAVLAGLIWSWTSLDKRE